MTTLGAFGPDDNRGLVLASHAFINRGQDVRFAHDVSCFDVSFFFLLYTLRGVAYTFILLLVPMIPWSGLIGDFYELHQRAHAFVFS
jgi:hypothetical protein